MPHDSQGNSWTGLAVQVNNTTGQGSYALNPTTDASHTFDSTATGSPIAVCAAVFSGVATFVAQNGSNGGGAYGLTSIQPGSITPQAGDLIVTMVGLEENAAKVSIDNGFTIVTRVLAPAGKYTGCAIAYKVAAYSAAVNPRWSWTGSSDLRSVASIASFRPAPGCIVSALPLAVAGQTYSGATATGVCAGDTYSVTAGSLPSWASLDSSTGVISGTASGSGTASFTIHESMKSQSQALSIKTATWGAASCAGNSPNSAKCSWTTDEAASSQVTCTGGGTYATPEVDAVKPGVGAYYGVTSHSIAITGLPTDTSSSAYTCTVSSRYVNGSVGTASAGTTGTLAALTSVPFTVASHSPPIYYNDQANGLHGFAANGRWYDSDTFWGTWADDGWYVEGNDFHGVNYCCSNNVGVIKLSSDQLTITQLGNTTGSNSTGPFVSNGYPTAYTQDGTRPYAEGIVSVRGNMYLQTLRYGGSNTMTNGCTVLTKTTDHWATTIAPQANTGPGATGSTYTGARRGAFGYPTTQGQCTLPLNGWMHFARFCQDWGGAAGQFSCTHNAGTDGWVYSTGMSDVPGKLWLQRVRVEDIQITEASMAEGRYQVYIGSGHGSDGLLDSNWVTYDGVSGTDLSALGVQVHVKPQLHWLPAPFNRWALFAWSWPVAGDPSQGGAIRVIDLGQYPWAFGDGVVVANIPKDTVTYARYYPVFPNLVMPTWTDLGDGTARVRMSTTGSYQEQSSSANTDRYSPVYHDLVLAPRAGVVARQYIGDERGQHTGSGLDLLYTFDEISLDPTLHNRASLSGMYDSTGVAHANYSGQGMNGFGFPDSAGYGKQTTATITTPYNAALTDFTALVTFEHDANGAIPSAETVIDKGDFQVFRNSTTANSWRVRVGATTSSAFDLITDGAFATLIVRRVGPAVSVYGSDGVGESRPLAALTTFSDETVLGVHALTLGSMSGGTQPFYGTLGELAIFSRGLSDAELIGEVAAVRSDMAARNASVVIP